MVINVDGYFYKRIERNLRQMWLWSCSRSCKEEGPTIADLVVAPKSRSEEKKVKPAWSNYEKKINGWNGYKKTISLILQKSPFGEYKLAAILAKVMPTSRFDNVKKC